MRRWFFILIILPVSCVGILEVLYRFQVVDCYRGDLKQSNSKRDLVEVDGQETLLVFGDSFSAGPATYASHLDGALSGDWRTVNSAVGGSGVLQARIMAPGRYRRFRPSVVLYQVYIGNDLFDYRYPSAWGKVSFARSLYWTVSRTLRSLSWFNYKLGQLRYGIKYAKADPDGSVPDYYPEADVFDPEKFTLRDRIYAAAEPSYVADSVLLEGRLGQTFAGYLKEMDRLLDRCQSGECRVVVLVIPHFSQLGQKSADRGRRVGLERLEGPEFFAESYPFFLRLQDHLQRQRPDVMMINPLEDFRQMEDSGSHPYFQNDSHLNPIGQELLASIVRRHLRGLDEPSTTTVRIH